MATEITDKLLEEHRATVRPVTVWVSYDTTQLDLFGGRSTQAPAKRGKNVVRTRTRIIKRLPRAIQSLQPPRYPNAIALRERTGEYRWYIPVPDPAEDSDQAAAVNARLVLSQRRHPISVGMLAKLMGISRHKVLRHIHSGIFPQGSVTRIDKCYRIEPGAALWYYDWAVYDPNE